jgi:hypothetical protein
VVRLLTEASTVGWWCWRWMPPLKSASYGGGGEGSSRWR